jgi:hypothetical protein
MVVLYSCSLTTDRLLNRAIDRGPVIVVLRNVLEAISALRATH